MLPIDLAIVLLLLHAALGAFDTLYNHEWVERLPRRHEAWPELSLHALRSWSFAALFLGAAWVEWSGAWWPVLPGIIAFEYAVTLADSTEEDRTRRLTRIERINHMLLAMNTGLYSACIAWQAWDVWRGQPTALTLRAPGIDNTLLSVCAAGAALWALRDGLAARRLRREAAMTAPAPGVT